MINIKTLNSFSSKLRRLNLVVVEWSFLAFLLHRDLRFGMGNFSTFTPCDWDCSFIILFVLFFDNTISTDVELTETMGFSLGRCYTLSPKILSTHATQSLGYSVTLQHTNRDIETTSSILPPGYHVYIHYTKEPFTGKYLVKHHHHWQPCCTSLSNGLLPLVKDVSGKLSKVQM